MGLRDIAALLLLASIWGGSFIFMRVAAPEFGIYVLVAIRTVLATSVLLPILMMTGGVSQIFKHWFPIALVGLANTAVPFVLFNYSSLHLEAGVNAILNATAPMFGALVAWLWLGDKLTPTAIAGLALGFLGVTVISQQKLGEGDISFVPILTALLATTCYGIAASMMKRWLQGVRPLVVATGSQAMASIMLAPFALSTLPATMPSANAWLNAVALAILGTAIAYILYFKLIANVGPAKAISVAYMVPLFGIIWGVLFLQEHLSLQTIIGGVMILTGVALTTGVIGIIKRSRAAKTA
ncbi:EamA/RhaT family transporter [Alteromonas sp. KS69]|jgi:drug/metabolite transporter (DMT)-like permease|uniref:Transmembrane protein n=1 Tax=Alteromonas naphthalenivorans TaxID=715451 RepID=F5Z6T9_ALTNA|nr:MULTISPECIES: DMT family transporter [Alteromonas]AEF05602.1 putative transmembrane protein [Alteromonas naphthalenivorans]MBO7921195.1 DMT family transporter [Alteromonas sp. K632G]PHS45958.1 MAG: EamA/RhaT family transporter [Alteromonas sp.]RUP75178.1 EamA/RhaT family transporter [Alteromonas sp. KS69]|tara:strand:+ start:722 stop:1612 length:891 start_codon:yes stop_codon:yes gene_type:complete